jgi:uncharacterized protein
MKTIFIFFTMLTASSLSMFEASRSFAASFDCTRATSNLEKAICSDQGLSSLDSKLGDVYHQAMARTSNPESLKISQREWIKRLNACNAVDCLKQAYETRIAELSHANGSDIEPPETKKSDASQPTTTEKPGLATSLAVAAAPPSNLAREIGHDYVGMLVHYLRANPQAINDMNLERWWAAWKFPQEFNQDRNQDFKMAALCDRAKEDMAKTVAQNDPNTVDITLRIMFREYDFQKQCFPVTLGNGDIFVNNPNYVNGSPRQFVLRVDGLDVANCLPLERDRAQVFFQKHMEMHGQGDRALLMTVRVKFDSSFADQLKTKAMNGQPILAKLGNVTFLDPSRDGRSDPEVVAMISGSQLDSVLAERANQKAEAEKAEAERQAQLRLEQAKASRDRDIGSLRTSPLSVRLANYLNPGPVNLGLTLANLRAARFRSLLMGKPIQVGMLIQTDSGGKADVATKWPGLLAVTAPEGTEFKASSWYLVQGMISVPEDDGLPPSKLAASSVIACSKENCEDLGDATAIIDHKLSNASGGSK